jgi:hypothetical protein
MSAIMEVYPFQSAPKTDNWIGYKQFRLLHQDQSERLYELRYKKDLVQLYEWISTGWIWRENFMDAEMALLQIENHCDVSEITYK